MNEGEGPTWGWEGEYDWDCDGECEVVAELGLLFEYDCDGECVFEFHPGVFVLVWAFPNGAWLGLLAEPPNEVKLKASSSLDTSRAAARLSARSSSSGESSCFGGGGVGTVTVISKCHPRGEKGEENLMKDNATYPYSPRCSLFSISRSMSTAMVDCRVGKWTCLDKCPGWTNVKKKDNVSMGRNTHRGESRRIQGKMKRKKIEKQE